jgi:FixJ family two-component response regulator
VLSNPQITRGDQASCIRVCRGLLGSAACVIADDGLELQRRIRLGRPALPVILISAHYDGDVRQRALQGGAKEFFYKPFDAAALLSAIGQALAER